MAEIIKILGSERKYLLSNGLKVDIEEYKREMKRKEQEAIANILIKKDKKKK